MKVIWGKTGEWFFTCLNKGHISYKSLKAEVVGWAIVRHICFI